jgi:hypothetical protein
MYISILSPLEYFTAIWYILCPFSGHWVYSTRFGMLYQEQSGNRANEPCGDTSLYVCKQFLVQNIFYVDFQLLALL